MHQTETAVESVKQLKETTPTKPHPPLLVAGREESEVTNSDQQPPSPSPQAPQAQPPPPTAGGGVQEGVSDELKEERDSVGDHSHASNNAPVHEESSEDQLPPVTVSEPDKVVSTTASSTASGQKENGDLRDSKERETDPTADSGGQWGSMLGRLRKMVVATQQQQEPASPGGGVKVFSGYITASLVHKCTCVF